MLFAPVIGDGDRTALLIDANGRVEAGLYVDSTGADISEEIGSALAGLGDESRRALENLGMGEWRAIVCESGDAIFALGPADASRVVLVAADPRSPVGSVRRFLSQAQALVAKP